MVGEEADVGVESIDCDRGWVNLLGEKLRETTILSMNTRTHRGLTRLEIITLVFIAGAAFCILMPYLASSRNSSRQTQCDRKLQELARTTTFVAQLKDEFPGYSNLRAKHGKLGRLRTGWVFPLLPFISRPIDPVTLEPPGPDVLGPRADIHLKYGPAGEDEERGQEPDRYLPELVCPADPRLASSKRLALLTYVANCGLPDAQGARESVGVLLPDGPESGVFLDKFPEWKEPYQLTIPEIEAADGSEFTLLFSENIDASLWTDATEPQVGFVWSVNDGLADPVAMADGALADGAQLSDEQKGWLREMPSVLPMNAERGQGDRSSLKFARPSSMHGDGVMVVYVDGHTRWTSDKIDPRIFQHQMTPMGTKVRFLGTEVPMPEPWREVRE